MTGVADLPMDELAAVVAAAMPVLCERIPAAPACLLGRLAAPRDPGAPTPGGHWPHPAVEGEPAGLGELRTMGALPVERLLGALEIAVAGRDWGGVPELLTGVPRPQQGGYAWIATGGADSEATSAARLLEQMHPGLAGRTAALVDRLAGHPAVTGALAVPAGVTDEAGIAAAHGAAHLALGVAVAGVLVHQADPWPVVERAAAAVGLGVGAAALLLRRTPMPAAYAVAQLDKIRAGYLLPRHMSGSVSVAGHRFGLSEHGLPADADFTGNGLVAVADGAVVVRTGAGQGLVHVDLDVLGEPPAEAEPAGWEEIVEVSWHAAEGLASVVGADGPGGDGLRRQTPPWAGDYRVRVYARGRDESDAGFERYRFEVWAAPAGPEIVHQRTDRLGHRLRGEPEPVRAERPERAYRWVHHTDLSMAATVTVVTGSTLQQALQAFGADVHRPEPIDELREEAIRGPVLLPWAAAFDLGDAVLLVEDNGFRGTDEAVLRAASAHGRAASMFWNVNAVTRLSFAERGRLLASFEPWGGEEVSPEVAVALAGLDFAVFGDRTEKGLVAVERFTGRAVTAADHDRLLETGVGYRLTG
ncbi:DUF6461 domain-containing protein [Couchioplanes caeruleus]|uniref:DUF6461 domain-containing protein n=1 Tax=Couchioplanes caeruleus TaxID=56438 RepID=UPI0020C03F34|nr:DUF6461 domain-containing protein [Couchioplanes caeruleus]UQU62677.1 DUF6461 domain-containing protein [Couchioplanes caeruleus]